MITRSYCSRLLEVIAVVGMLWLMGCNEAATPQQAIDHVIHAIQTRSQGEIGDYLLGEAKQDYGSKQGMAQLASLTKGRVVSGYVERFLGQRMIRGQRLNYYDVGIYAGSDMVLKGQALCASESIDGNRDTSPTAVLVTFCFLNKLGITL